jgi:hypothetical protein
MDLYYVENWSLLWDCALVARSAMQMVAPNSALFIEQGDRSADQQRCSPLSATPSEIKNEAF